jgi:transposase
MKTLRIQSIEIEAVDSRKIGPEALYERHLQYVRFRKAGISNNQASALVGFCATTGSKTWKKYQKEGLEGLKVKRRGLPQGYNRALTPSQEEEIQKTMANNTPDALGLPYSLWSREAAKRLILEKYGVDLALRTISLYFSRWGFTYQRPAKRAYKQDPQEVERWLEEEYPQIQEEAMKEEAEIYWCDETGIENATNDKRGFSPKGQTPILKVEVKKEKVNMISGMTNEGKLRFMLYAQTMTTVLLIMFLQRLIRSSGHKIYVIMDNLKVHHSKKLQEWLKNHENEIKVYYLPPYSPELNPDEYLNGKLKKDIHSGISPRTKVEIMRKVRCFMQRHQRAPNDVKQLFQHEQAQYAA